VREEVEQLNSDNSGLHIVHFLWSVLKLYHFACNVQLWELRGDARATLGEYTDFLKHGTQKIFSNEKHAKCLCGIK